MGQPYSVRRQRAAERANRHANFRILLGRLGQLSPAEADLLRRCAYETLAELADLRRTVQGQTRTVEEMAGRVAAADEAIREVERDRDAAREELAAARAYERALVEAHGPAHPSLFGVGGTVCGTCHARVPGRLSLPHACPPPAVVVVELLRDEDGQPICTCTHDQRCPACAGTVEQRPTTTKEN